MFAPALGWVLDRLIFRALSAAADAAKIMATVGVLLNEPVTFTAALLFVEPAEPDDADPQPARTAQAASGTSRAAAMRRMEFLSVGFKTSQPTGPGRLNRAISQQVDLRVLAKRPTCRR